MLLITTGTCKTFSEQYPFIVTAIFCKTFHNKQRPISSDMFESFRLSHMISQWSCMHRRLVLLYLWSSWVCCLWYTYATGKSVWNIGQFMYCNSGTSWIQKVLKYIHANYRFDGSESCVCVFRQWMVLQLNAYVLMKGLVCYYNLRT